MSNLAVRLDRALRAAGIAIVGVSIGTESDRSTWKVSPPSLQAAAQPVIDALDATADDPEPGDSTDQVIAAFIRHFPALVAETQATGKLQEDVWKQRIKSSMGLLRRP